MTYYNGDTYAGPAESAPLDKWAHDSYLPDDQFTVHTFANGDTLRQQVWPWNWSPVYGAAKPCTYCGQPVEHEVNGVWRPLAPVMAA